MNQTVKRLGFAIMCSYIVASFIGVAPAAFAEEEAASILPTYSTATSPDPGKPLWPDPTGANAGYWATPSPGPVGDDDPAKLSNAQLYDRIAHNLF